MSIIEEAETFKWKETGEKIAQTLKEINYPNKDLAFYELLRYFDITNPDELKNPEILKKVQAIFEYLKNSEDILMAVRNLNSQVGNPLDLEERLNKIYAFVYSANIEKEIESKGQEEVKTKVEEIDKRVKELEIQQELKK